MVKKLRLIGLAVTLLAAAHGVPAQTPVVIDNGAAQFATVGTWPTSTVVPGFEGANYQTHEAQGSPPGAIVVDNTRKLPRSEDRPRGGEGEMTSR